MRPNVIGFIDALGFSKENVLINRDPVFTHIYVYPNDAMIIAIVTVKGWHTELNTESNNEIFITNLLEPIAITTYNTMDFTELTIGTNCWNEIK